MKQNGGGGNPPRCRARWRWRGAGRGRRVRGIEAAGGGRELLGLDGCSAYATACEIPTTSSIEHAHASLALVPAARARCPGYNPCGSTDRSADGRTAGVRAHAAA